MYEVDIGPRSGTFTEDGYYMQSLFSSIWLTRFSKKYSTTTTCISVPIGFARVERYEFGNQFWVAIDFYGGPADPILLGGGS